MTSKYYPLIPSQSANLPKFVAVVEAMTAGFEQQQAAMAGWSQSLDIDAATGANLDLIGEWVGVRRTLKTQLVGVYFEWDSIADIRWDDGVWKGPDDPDSGLVSLQDDAYRNLLRTKIKLNHWDGGLESLRAIWSDFLPEENTGVLVDNQDMTMTLGYFGPPITGVREALMLLGAALIKPAAVRVREFIRPADSNLLFVWDDPVQHRATMDSTAVTMDSTVYTMDLTFPMDVISVGWDTNSWPAILPLNP